MTCSVTFTLTAPGNRLLTNYEDRIIQNRNDEYLVILKCRKARRQWRGRIKSLSICACC